MTTPNMGMTLPTPTVTPGPLYATEIVADLTTIDSHDHSPGKGAPIANNTYLGMAEQASDPLVGVTTQGGIYVDTNGNLNYHNPSTDSSVLLTPTLASAQAHKTGTQVVAINTLTIITYTGITKNTGGCFAATGDIFTVPVTGDYLVTAQIYISATTNFTGTTTLSIYNGSSSVADFSISNFSLANDGSSGLGAYTIAINTIVGANNGAQLSIKMLTTAAVQYTVGATGMQSIVSFKQLT